MLPKSNWEKHLGWFWETKALDLRMVMLFLLSVLTSTPPRKFLSRPRVSHSLEHALKAVGEQLCMTFPHSSMAGGGLFLSLGAFLYPNISPSQHSFVGRALSPEVLSDLDCNLWRLVVCWQQRGWGWFTLTLQFVFSGFALHSAIISSSKVFFLEWGWIKQLLNPPKSVTHFLPFQPCSIRERQKYQHACFPSVRADGWCLALRFTGVNLSSLLLNPAVGPVGMIFMGITT